MTNRTVDVAIIGGGLIGCFAAYYLRQRGRSVAIIDKGQACSAASATNFGNLRVQGRNPEEFPLALRALAIWTDLERITGEDCGFNPCGHVYLGFADADRPVLERAAANGLAAGLDIELMDGPAARRQFPALSEVVQRASWSKRDAVAEPSLAAPAVARLAARAGAVFLEQTRVTAIEAAAAGYIVRTEAGHTMTCGQVVNAAGAWGGELARQLGEPVAMLAAGPPLCVIAPEHAYHGPSLHAVDGTLLLRPSRGGLAVAGSFPRVPADLATGTAEVAADRIEPGLKRIREAVPSLGHLRVERYWSGVEGYLPDMLPVLGWSGKAAGVFHAFGFSGHGYLLAPGVGEAIAEMLVDGRSETPLERFAMARFAAGSVVDARTASGFDLARAPGIAPGA